MPYFGRRSKEALSTCHIDLQRIANKAIEIVDFSVICGHRGAGAQDRAFNKGYSKVVYPNSRHNRQPSEALDFAPYPIDWKDIERFRYQAGIMMGIAHVMGIELKWGGNWETFKDYGHLQLGS